MSTEIFEAKEAQVRSYCRSFPTVFTSGRNATLTDENDRSYIDFLVGAGALNYGHNHPEIRDAVVNYMMKDGVSHALDMYTEAKRSFLETFEDKILQPRSLEYKITFPGPTGTNAVETAMKIARRATGRENIIAFTNAFHGMTLGALAASGNLAKRSGAGMPLTGITRVPYENYLDGLDAGAYLEKVLSDGGSGVDAPAAVIVETVQAEGGLNTASSQWLKEVAEVAQRHGALLIVDDIQTGCGRTGTFFSFEGMGFTPDIVCLSKSIGGMGLPMALVLFRPDLDVLKPGEHNGTFRGNNLAFVAATEALKFWSQPEFLDQLEKNIRTVGQWLARMSHRHAELGAHVRGRGLLVGLGWRDSTLAGQMSREAFAKGAIAETTGADDEVLKLMPPLTISERELATGLDRLETAIDTVCASAQPHLALQAAE